jgi:hypothetical protein
MHLDVLSVLSLFTATPFMVIAAILGFHQFRRAR